MKQRAKALLQDLRVLFDITEAVVRRADECLRPGPRRRRVALQTLEGLLLERQLQPPRWVLELILELTWRRRRRALL